MGKRYILCMMGMIAIWGNVQEEAHAQFLYEQGCFVEFSNPGLCAPAGGLFNCTVDSAYNSLLYGNAVGGTLCGALILGASEKISCENDFNLLVSDYNSLVGRYNRQLSQNARLKRKIRTLTMR